MAVLDETDRKELWAQFMSDVCARQENLSSGGPMTKHDLKDAVDAIDIWVQDNKASFNDAIPLPARTVLSADHKAELLVYVVKRRWEIGI